MHVWFSHATVAPHAPAALHFWVPLVVVHCTAPGEHSTHAPFQQMAVVPAHVVWFCHMPEAVHCCTTVPTHCVSPGAQSPVHTPATQAWFTQHFVPHAMPPSQSGGGITSPVSEPVSRATPLSLASGLVPESRDVSGAMPPESCGPTVESGWLSHAPPSQASS
jgi:hypothetical protein